MKNIVLGAALAAAATTASAADLPRKAQVYKAPILQVYDWTGFYIGVNAGGGVGRSLTRTTIPGFTSEVSHLSPAGGIGGGQIGYNFQFRNFYNLVLGVEADIQASDQRDNYACLLVCLPPSFFQTYNQKIDWFGTVRGRAGIANGPVLTYVTGGYAYGHVNTSSTANAGLASATLTVSETRGGYAIGSGVEAQLGGNWTGKIEYLYVDLGTQNTSGTIGGAAFAGSTKIRDNIFRAGLNYNFGNNTGYVAPVANWTGFYLGGNFGSVIGRNRSAIAFAGFAQNPRFTLVPEGFSGGGQIGYNWQSSAWVFGLEADFQGTTAKDNKACVLICGPNGGAAPAAIFSEQKLSYLGTVRGRIGYTVGSTLFYGTGGYAYGETKTRLSESAIGITSPTVELKRSKGGYAAGVGIESSFNPLNLFGPNWTSTAEYLYVDLGRSTFNFTTTAFAPQTFTTATREHIFRTGINYHFNQPVVAKY